MAFETVRTDDGSLTLKHANGELFHSDSGARSEAINLYVKSSSFLDQLRGSEPVAVFDIGLGLGYTGVACVEHWLGQDSKADLRIFSFEKNHDLLEQFLTAEAPWQANWPSHQLDLVKQFEAVDEEVWEMQLQHEGGAMCTWRIVGSDAFDFLPDSDLKADFVWYDPFSPRRDESAWSDERFELLRRHSKDDAQLMTYSVANVTKNNLQAAGWQTTEIPTTNQRKNSWLQARAAPLN